MDDIGKNIISTSLSIRRFIDSIINSFNLKSSQGRMLKFISENEDVTACKLEEYFNLQKATVSDHLNALEELGYIKRVVDNLDARKKIIILTEKGNIINKKINESLLKYQLDFSSLLTEEEKVIVSNALEKIKNSLKEEVINV